MFFIFGISSKEKDIDFNQSIVCESCGSYGRLNIFMTYSYFSLFFIPIFKWNKKYYVRKSCCGSLYSIDKELGKDIEKGRIKNIEESDLKPININNKNTCWNCKYPLEREYEFCPKCGKKI